MASRAKRKLIEIKKKMTTLKKNLNIKNCNFSKIENLRKIIKREGLDGYRIKTGDQHFNEYPQDKDKRLQYISGFTGSLAVAIITLENAYIWVDFRYHIQAEREICKCWNIYKLGLPGVLTIGQWLINQQNQKLKIGVNSNLIIYSSIEIPYLIPIDKELIDEIWEDKSKPFYGEIFIHNIEYSGISSSQKFSSIKSIINKNELIILSSMEEIAWICNLRGNDIPYFPIFYSYMIISENKNIIFLNLNSLNQEINDYLTSLNIEIENYSNFLNYLEKIIPKYSIIRLNNNVSFKIGCIIEKYKKITDQSFFDEIAKKKAIKNEKEIQGFKKCNIDEGIAIVRYLTYLEDILEKGEEIGEYDAIKKLNFFRRKSNLFFTESFKTISSSGKNSAIVHYIPKENNQCIIDRNEIYLLDTGGHYLNGTTDITRTFCFGKITPLMKDLFTLVLKSVISLSEAVFYNGTKWNQLDILSRINLLKYNFDYGHATGHGIGNFLGVHENPPDFSDSNTSELFSGMIISNEPGLYFEGKFGIRIENNMVIIPYVCPKDYDNLPKSPNDLLSFETISYVPIQPSLIDKKKLSKSEINFINNYNQNVYKILVKELKKSDDLFDKKVIDWLIRNTSKI